MIALRLLIASLTVVSSFAPPRRQTARYAVEEPALCDDKESGAVVQRRPVLAGLAAAAALESSPTAAAGQRTYLVTGASSGIGFAAAGELARRGHRVALACRSIESAAATARRLPEGASVWTPQKAGCALDDLGAVGAFADEVSKIGRLDGALLIAGVDGAPRAAPDDDPHFRINYLSHALLARRLLPLLRTSRGRVVTVSSEALLDSDLSLKNLDENLVKQRGASPHTCYANSKACCVLLADALKAREPALSVAACALPGRCATQIVRYELPQRAAQRLTMTDDQLAKQAKQLGLRTAARGSALPVWIADAPEALSSETLWLDPGVPARLDMPWRSAAAASKLWDLTSTLLASYKV